MAAEGYRISFAATGSKTGKTFGLAEWVIEMATLLPPGSLIWWVAPYWKTVAIGCAGLPPLRDYRGEPDADGREVETGQCVERRGLARAGGAGQPDDGVVG